ncbi:MAG: tRNA lysidine(34) synthetase TilS [Bacteroides sp.]|nr:tRNA lysidine(34) synthetase TilS [Bacteroides sp.]
MLKRRVSQYIEKEKLFSLEDRILVALSGGADSVALLRILLSLGYKCKAAHCNFHLRGEESDRDEVFVRQLCSQLKTELHIIHFQTNEYAEKQKISIEMAARELRYNWFAELKDKTNANVIAVAHHQDDSAETILLNLIRGTGINGLRGIRPKNGDIVRPLLCITRNEITDYLQFINQDYITDSTNLQDEYIRNKIRLRLIPLMEEINPSVKEGLTHTGNHLNEVQKVYEKAIAESISRVRTSDGIHIGTLLAEVSPQAVLFEILYPLGFNSSQTDNIFQSLNGQPGKQFISNQGWRVIKDREYLLIKRNTEPALSPSYSLEIREELYTTDFVIPREKHIACFDADKIKNPLEIRKWKQGDEFYPFGMKGKKKVSDYLTDKKFSILQKENQWILCEGKNILWIIGERTDNRYRIESDTQRILIIKQYFE